MNRNAFCTFLLLFSVFSGAAALPSVTNYGLNYSIVPHEARFSSVVTLHIRNSTERPCEEIPMVLYRLCTVSSVTIGGRGVSFIQDIVPLQDDSIIQVRHITIHPANPIAPGDSVACIVSYTGSIFGYPEAMEYTKDHIGDDYSLFRPDVFAYPICAEPSFASIFTAMDSKFTYQVEITVPDSFVVACGGEQEETMHGAGTVTYRFRNRVPTGRIDIAAARFTVESNDTLNCRVYALPGDRDGALRVMKAAGDAIGYYTAKFGSPGRGKGYTVIEIPEGWGSQAGDFYFLQEAPAFRDSDRLGEVYHEVGHSWNARPDPSVQRCRYFDEAFASYFEAMALGEFRGEDAMAARMKRYREKFNANAAHDSVVFNTPIVRYGEKEIGQYSYTKGAWSLHVLHAILGDETFALVIRAVLTGYRDVPIDFPKFRATAENHSRRNLKRFFDEWIDGSESSELMAGKMTVEQMAERYVKTAGR
jgi:hypothetical protein